MYWNVLECLSIINYEMSLFAGECIYKQGSLAHIVPNPSYYRCCYWDKLISKDVPYLRRHGREVDQISIKRRLHNYIIINIIVTHCNPLSYFSPK